LRTGRGTRRKRKKQEEHNPTINKRTTDTSIRRRPPLHRRRLSDAVLRRTTNLLPSATSTFNTPPTFNSLVLSFFDTESTTSQLLPDAVASPLAFSTTTGEDDGSHRNMGFK